MNGFIKKSVGTLTLGEKLRKLRSERRISMNEVSRFTKIQVKYLEYLEDGRYEKLPADVYIKGFLRSYAEFLGVNENILIKLYEKEKGIKNNLEKSKRPAEKKTEAINISSFVFTPKIGAIILTALLVVGGFFYLYKEFGAFASVPRLVILSPEKNYSLSGNSIVVEGVTDRDARIFINDQPVLVNDDGKFRENLTVQSGTNIINIRALNRFDKEKIETLTIQSSYQEAESSEPPSDAESAASQKKEVEIEIKVDPGPVWLSVEADGNLVFSGTMLTGATQSFKGEDKISISSGKANATFVKFNGKDIGALGENASPVKGVIFTADTKY